MEQDAKQELFDELMKATLPKVLEILRDCAVSEEPKEVYAEVLKAICKFFWSVTFTKMPHGLEEPSTFKHLMDSLLILIKKELPWVIHALDAPCDVTCNGAVESDAGIKG